ncbi:hypothetical protein L195_g062497, partial [Trifolium pratense]
MEEAEKQGWKTENCAMRSGSCAMRNAKRKMMFCCCELRYAQPGLCHAQ